MQENDESGLRSPQRDPRRKDDTRYLLHISDVHLKSAEEAHKYLAQITIDLQKELQVARLDYMTISGDVGDQSLPEEYEAAFELIMGLAVTLHLDRERVIMVPGNHDLNWGISKQAHSIDWHEELRTPGGGSVPPGTVGFVVRDEGRYRERFVNFSKYLYEKITGFAYPLDPTEQAVLFPFRADRLLFLALNSCWSIDHKSTERASINMDALSKAMCRVQNGAYDDWTKIALWHHPVTGRAAMEDEFLEMLSRNGFQIGMHGHIHEAQQRFRDEARGIHIVGAGTFGAPANEQVPHIGHQYNLIRIDRSQKLAVVYTRKKEKEDGAWEADARWGDTGRSPESFYKIALAD